MRKNKIIGYISVAVLSAISGVVSQWITDREIDEQIKEAKNNDKETE